MAMTPMTASRRAWLARHASLACGTWAATSLLGACASAPQDAADRIVEAGSGRSLEPGEVLHRMRQASVVLLGELHDNPHHHARRAQLLLDIGAPVSVVAEQLPRGAAPVLPPQARGDTLRQALEAGGFDARAWRWPLHEPLFAAVARAGHRLHGGNLEREAARRLAREGAAAMPADLTPLVSAQPLGTAAAAALEQDLQHGHCGRLPADRTPGMVAAQRGRDAAMAQVLLTLLAQGSSAQSPVVLLAGNGHVRRDYGVPALLVGPAGRVPPARLLSIGFLEAPLPVGAAQRLPYDILWTTAAANRDDPCKAFPAARPASA